MQQMNNLIHLFVYCSARFGTSSLEENGEGTDMVPLFETIFKKTYLHQLDMKTNLLRY